MPKDEFETFDDCFDALSNARDVLLRHPKRTVQTQAVYDGLIMIENFLIRREIKERKIAELVKAAKAVVKAK